MTGWTAARHPDLGDVLNVAFNQGGDVGARPGLAPRRCSALAHFRVAAGQHLLRHVLQGAGLGRRSLSMESFRASNNSGARCTSSMMARIQIGIQASSIWEFIIGQSGLSIATSTPYRKYGSIFFLLAYNPGSSTSPALAMLAGFSLVTGRVKATNKVDGYGGRGDDCGGPVPIGGG